MYKQPVAEKNMPDISSIKNVYPLPIYREKSIVSGVASNRHKLLRQLRAKREIQLQQEFIGHTSINPIKYIKRRLESLAHPDATASIESGSLSQSLVPTLNTSRPVSFTVTLVPRNILHLGQSRTYSLTASNGATNGQVCIWNKTAEKDYNRSSNKASRQKAGRWNGRFKVQGPAGKYFVS